MRLLPLALLFFALDASASWERYVNLDEPGALHELSVSNPAHYRQVMTAVSSEKAGCDQAWAHYKIASRTAACRSHLLMTSFPPKGHLTVRLDDVLYAITVTFDTAEYKISRAR